MSNGRVYYCWFGIVPKGYGRFYIMRRIYYEDAQFEDELEHEYLHADGIWRKRIQNEAGEYTGWHASREIANRLLAEAKD